VCCRIAHKSNIAIFYQQFAPSSFDETTMHDPNDSVVCSLDYHDTENFLQRIAPRSAYEDKSQQ
jgi:hypothetical protein